MKNLSIILAFTILFLGCENEEPLTEHDIESKEFLEWALGEYDLTGFRVIQMPEYEILMELVECENLLFEIVAEDRGVAINFLIQETLACSDNLYYNYSDIVLGVFWEGVEDPIYYLDIELNE